jgi:hypothetical protein
MLGSIVDQPWRVGRHKAVERMLYLVATEPVVTDFASLQVAKAASVRRSVATCSWRASSDALWGAPTYKVTANFVLLDPPNSVFHDPEVD